jgi:hypothetical protein
MSPPSDRIFPSKMGPAASRVMRNLVVEQLVPGAVLDRDLAVV